MKLLISKAAISLCAVWCLNPEAQASVFEYAKQLHGVSREECEREGADLMLRVARLSGGHGRSIFCEARSHQVMELSVFVDTPTAPTVERATFAFFIVEDFGSNGPVNRSYQVLDKKSGFSRLDSCVAALPSLENSFAGQTGLEPVASQCIKLGDYSFIAQVDGFGAASKSLHELDIDMGRSAVSNVNFDDLAGFMRARGMEAVYRGYERNYLQLKYYSASELVLRGFEFKEKNVFVTESQCEAARTTVNRTLLLRRDLSLVSLTCNQFEGARGRGMFALSSIFDLTGRVEQGFSVGVETMGRYGTQEECDAARVGFENAYCSASLDSLSRVVGYDLTAIH